MDPDADEHPERWLVIDGRHWRRTDPDLPDEIVTALKSHLGRARSAVRIAKAAADDETLRDARGRVNLAKTGLGERGPHWWDDELPARITRARDAVSELDRLAPREASPPG